MMKRRGFTLVELMVTTALLGGILVVLSLIISGSSQNTSFLTGRGVLTATVSNAVETITSYALLGSDLPAAYSTTSHTYSRGPSTLILSIPSVDALGAPIASSFDSVVVDCVQGECTLYIFPAGGSSRAQTQRTVISGLASSSFVYDLTPGRKIITVVFTGSQISHGNTVLFPMTQTTYLFNQST